MVHKCTSTTLDFHVQLECVCPLCCNRVKDPQVTTNNLFVAFIGSSAKYYPSLVVVRGLGRLAGMHVFGLFG